MQTKGYSHLDLKCDNILLDRNLIAKLGDFGFAQSNINGITKATGTDLYMAPEICLR